MTARPGGDVRLALAEGEIEARWAGEPAGDAIVLLHEGLGSVAQWRDFPQALAAETGRPVFAYSRFGYGGSSPCPMPRPLDYLEREAVDVLPRVLEAAGVEGGWLIGHSDGASIALLYAARRPAPGLRGLVLEAPHVFVEPSGEAELRRAREAYERGDLRAKLARYHGDGVDVAFYGWNNTWLDPAYASWNVEALLPSIRVPSLLLQGEDDRYGTRAHVDAIARGSGAPTTLLMMPCGHTPHRELPEQTLSAIASYLDRHPLSFVHNGMPHCGVVRASGSRAVRRGARGPARVGGFGVLEKIRVGQVTTPLKTSTGTLRGVLKAEALAEKGAGFRHCSCLGQMAEGILLGIFRNRFEKISIDDVFYPDLVFGGVG